MSTVQEQRENVESLRMGLLELLEGMDYCLDWKPDDSLWSAREVVYHLLDTPPGGTPSVVRGIVSGEISEYEIWSDRTNVTDVRSTRDMDEVREDIGSFFSAFGEALEKAGDADLAGAALVVSAPAYAGRGTGADAGGSAGRFRPALAGAPRAAGGVAGGAGVVGVGVDLNSAARILVLLSEPLVIQQRAAIRNHDAHSDYYRKPLIRAAFAPRLAKCRPSIGC